MNRNYWTGIALTVLGATLWGVSGTAVQFLGHVRHVNVEWLVTVRLIMAGLITVGYAYYCDGPAVFDVFRHPRDVMRLIIFGVFGMALCQYTYFKAILIAGVGIVTVLQYLAPSIIIIYLFVRYGKLPTPGESISVF